MKIRIHLQKDRKGKGYSGEPYLACPKVGDPWGAYTCFPEVWLRITQQNKQGGPRQEPAFSFL